MFSVAVSLATAFPFADLITVLRNVPGMTWTPGMPERFAGHSLEQMQSMLMNVPKVPMTTEKVEMVGAAPASHDWPTLNPACVNHIRDQGQCGSCWAFSAVAAFGDRRCILKKDASYVQYSEQHVVSCDKIDQGCNGGYINMVWLFLTSTGTTTDVCVPYTSGKAGVTGVCATKCKDGSALKMTKSAGASDVATSEESMMNAVVEGPITTGFTVYADFEVYTKGIYHHVVGSNMGGHAVEIVGYGIENGTKFWNVKNSWGASWGEKGYFRIVKGTNECGIEEQCMAAKF